MKKSIKKKNQKIFNNLQKKQEKTIAVGVIKRKKNKFFNNPNSSFVTDGKLFWKKTKTFFSNKNDHGTNIKLVAGDET